MSDDQLGEEEAAFLASFEKLLCEGPVAAFVGAGVSYHSGLPLVPAIERHILEALEVEPEHAPRILEAQLPFEAFVQALSAGGPIEALFSMFEGGSPSTTHRFLAKLLRSGRLRSIFTTNFDTLIEDALADEGWRPKDDYDLLCTAADFDQAELRGRPSLVKIHGSVTETQDMAITLRQVSERALVASRARLVEQLFSRQWAGVLVLGYSCSDFFDLVPRIESVQEPSHGVLFVEHTFQDSTLSGTSAPISAKPERNPFKRFGNGVRVYSDTDRLVRHFWRALIPDEYRWESVATSGPAWRKIVDDWASATDTMYLKGPKNSRLAALFAAVTEHELAIEYNARALSFCKQTNAAAAALEAIMNIGDSARELGQYARANAAFEEAAGHAREWGWPLLESRAVCGQGQVANALSRYDEAVAHYERALSLAEEANDRYGQGATLADLGTAWRRLGDMSQARRCLEAALSIAEEVGDKGGEANRIAALAQIDAESGDPAAAARGFERSLALARLTGDRYLEALMLANTGNLHCQRREFLTAVPFLGQGLNLANLIGARSIAAGCLQNLGLAYFKHGQLAIADTFLRRATTLVRELGDRRGESQALGTLAFILADSGEVEDACALTEEALEIALEVGDKPTVRVHIANLLVFHRDLGNQERLVELEVLAAELAGMQA
ncbi:MAG TPA: tetratricopeptide repeat protein [Polyangiaceae bacterium]|nr:tetratricopeptide repeat protein [Polyangiaceae bacterium]